MGRVQPFWVYWISCWGSAMTTLLAMEVCILWFVLRVIQVAANRPSQHALGT